MRKFILHITFSIMLTGLIQVPAYAQEWLPRNVEEDKMTIENLAAELIRQDVDHWRVVLAQAIVESGWNFDSYLFRHTNNFIGMRIPYARKSTRVGSYKGYSVYATWKDCVKDIKLWQESNWEGGSEEEYIALMHKIWSESPQYYSAVNSVMRRVDRLLLAASKSQLPAWPSSSLQAYRVPAENPLKKDL